MLVITKFDISFTDFDKQKIFIPAGTEIFVDAEEGIGFYKDLHFTVEKSEYIVFTTH